MFKDKSHERYKKVRKMLFFEGREATKSVMFRWVGMRGGMQTEAKTV